MQPYLYLFLAIITEIIATSALKVSDGFTKPLASIIVLVGYFFAFWLLSLTLKVLPVSIVYAIWSGLGILGISCIGIWYFKEMFGVWHFIGTALILAGVVILSIVTPNNNSPH
ncbi:MULTISPECIES: DMT family transporter [Parachlamydia]|jgi:multidrug transporter EmrE-like cation transporter|uniref:Quaternary ammonium compound-resistance protein qacE n=2 Tax=Parachlamydia acanthamoebae TaxID=83552 RepID=F8L1K7_PARAV|nr:multidrug efflux SMR transporter [Parachlamydia acanthamoebae]EFB41438.1 hypothetical protein pah_c039o012 [Parachlamydia acanthamoebae str. Hall's coccus]KIA77109.1 Quaternary ammonium compound-resistance protein QacE [Parachlamydia acanthamoebae]CCB87149.1 quaternary ammonium compound-resistance protein qacE [Parachlamydia acanthamoebae UV-7]